MRDLNALVLEYPLLEGAMKSGIATPETLSGGPPSVDLSYVLPGAKSAVAFPFLWIRPLYPTFWPKKTAFPTNASAAR